MKLHELLSKIHAHENAVRRHFKDEDKDALRMKAAEAVEFLGMFPEGRHLEEIVKDDMEKLSSTLSRLEGAVGAAQDFLAETVKYQVKEAPAKTPTKTPAKKG